MHIGVASGTEEIRIERHACNNQYCYPDNNGTTPVHNQCVRHGAADDLATLLPIDEVCARVARRTHIPWKPRAMLDDFSVNSSIINRCSSIANVLSSFMFLISMNSSLWRISPELFSWSSTNSLAVSIHCRCWIRTATIWSIRRASEMSRWISMDKRNWTGFAWNFSLPRRIIDEKTLC